MKSGALAAVRWLFSSCNTMPTALPNFSSFFMAIKEINDKTDGVADTLLPNTQLQFA